MLYIEQRATNEVKEHGVDINLIIDKTEPDTSLFQNEQNLHIVEAMFKTNDVTHTKISEIIDAVDKSIEVYDKALVSAIFDEIVALDQQSYADIMSVVKAVLIALNDKAFTVTANSIKHIVSSENGATETEEESVDVVEEDKKEEEASETEEK